MADSATLGIDWTRLALILIACGGMGCLLVWLRHQKARAGHGLLEIKDRLRLGPRQQVIALRVGDQTLLLGATGERLVLLSEVQEATPAPTSPEEAEPSPFARVLASNTQALEEGRSGAKAGSASAEAA